MSSTTCGYWAGLARRLLDPVPAGDCKLQTLRGYYRLPQRDTSIALGNVETVVDLIGQVLRPTAEKGGLDSWQNVRDFTTSEWYPARLGFGSFKGRPFRDAVTDDALRDWLATLSQSPNPRNAAVGAWYNGDPLPPRLVRALREHQGDSIDAWLQQQCGAINAELAAITEIHLQCPSPGQEPAYRAATFTPAPPQEPVAKSPGFFGRLSPRVRRQIEAGNDAARVAWEQDVRRWRTRKARFEHAEHERRKLFQRSRRGSAAEMSNFFQRRIEELTWPRETLIAFQIDHDGKAMYVDVDLPEIEDLPRKQAAVPSRGLRLSMKDLSDAQNRRNYARHIHGVLFRVIGEAFASFPRIQRVVGSAFSQRLNRATGAAADEYLISVSVERTRWNQIDFSALDRVDPVAAIGRFNLRRRMTRTGSFTPVEPFTASTSA